MFRETFGISSGPVLSNAERTMAILRLMPSQVEELDPVSWIIRHTTDGTGELSPRNILTFLTRARTRQLVSYDREDPDVETTSSLLTTTAMWEAYKEVSEKRLQDTIYSEFSHLWPFIEKFRGKSYQYNTAGLASLLGVHRNSQEYLNLVSDLLYSGLLAQESSGRFVVPFLYRPALNLQRHSLKQPEAAEAKSNTGLLRSSTGEEGKQQSAKQRAQKEGRTKRSRRSGRKSRRKSGR
jgi:hypothetical protein